MSDIETTIKNLRTLAGHAEVFDEGRLFMSAYIIDKSEADEVKQRAFEDDTPTTAAFYDDEDFFKDRDFVYECQTACCLIGIADESGMGANKKSSWHDFSVELFPVLNDNPAWQALFGDYLEDNLTVRVGALRQAADMLEKDGVIDPWLLPG